MFQLAHPPAQIYQSTHSGKDIWVSEQEVSGVIRSSEDDVYKEINI